MQSRLNIEAHWHWLLLNMLSIQPGGMPGGIAPGAYHWSFDTEACLCDMLVGPMMGHWWIELALAKSVWLVLSVLVNCAISPDM